MMKNISPFQWLGIVFAVWVTWPLLPCVVLFFALILTLDKLGELIG